MFIYWVGPYHVTWERLGIGIQTNKQGHRDNTMKGHRDDTMKGHRDDTMKGHRDDTMKPFRSDKCFRTFAFLRNSTVERLWDVIRGVNNEYF